MDLRKEKISQIKGILDELNIDLWLVFVRETAIQADPVADLIIGTDLVWPSFFLYTRKGEAIALVGNLDREDFVRSGLYTDVRTYTEGAGAAIRDLITGLDPKIIGINYSKDNPSADGLTHGMYLLLQDFLNGTPYAGRLVCAENVCTRVRSRKTATEIDLVSKAAALADRAWNAAVMSIASGMTERDIAGIVEDEISRQGFSRSFSTIANAGSKTSPGHGLPTDARLEPGDLLHVDFGAKYEYYCSDIQRLLYIRRPDEDKPPQDLLKAFDLIKQIITEAAKRTVPGITGREVDAFARRMLTENGHPEYQHALGHQLGRAVHDGGALIGPPWERYGQTPDIPLEEGNIFTLELEIMLPEIGCVGLEEDIAVTADGGRFLGPRQLELIVK